jgi:hypothetical protein
MLPALLALTASLASGQNREAPRLNQHRVANRSSPAPEPGAEDQPIPSLIEGLRSADEWDRVRRPQLLRLWTSILGKLDPPQRLAPESARGRTPGMAGALLQSVRQRAGDGNRAVGALTRTLEPRSQSLSFVLEVDR